MGQEGRERGVGLPPLLAHAARTIGMCSLDVRSEAEAAQPLWVEEGALGKGAFWRAWSWRVDRASLSIQGTESVIIHVGNRQCTVFR